MTDIERIKYLTKRVLRARRELARTMEKVSPENSILQGVVSSAVLLQGDITELRLLLQRMDLDWDAVRLEK